MNISEKAGNRLSVSVPFVEELTTFKSKLDYALPLLIRDQYPLRFIPEGASESGFALLPDLC